MNEEKEYTVRQETLENDEIRFIVATNKEYFVTINPFSCSCADFKFRKIKTGEFCKHIQVVIDSLAEEKDGTDQT
jgi:predicted nucleic acid-binding Zn finger protein